MTLLREDTWARVTANHPQKLEAWSEMDLVSAGGSPLTIHGSARVALELEGEQLVIDVVVVSPLTTEAILGLDFLKEQRASIDLAQEKLYLAKQRCTVPLIEPSPRLADNRVKVRMIATVQIPPCSELEVMACLEEPVEQGTWLLEEVAGKRAPTAVARAILQPTSTLVPVRLLNPRHESITIYSGTEIATIESVQPPVNSVNTVSSSEPEAITKEKIEMLRRLVEEQGAELSSSEREQFFNLLQANADVLASSTASAMRQQPFSVLWTSS